VLPLGFAKNTNISRRKIAAGKKAQTISVNFQAPETNTVNAFYVNVAIKMPPSSSVITRIRDIYFKINHNCKKDLVRESSH